MRLHLCWLLACAFLTACSSATAPASMDSGATLALPPAFSAEQGIFGAYTLRLEGTPESPTAELEPVRTGSAPGDSYLLDASRYFTGALCGDCVRVSGIALVDLSTIDLSITVRHPFLKPPPTLGPKDRLDLHIFDVQGLLVSAEPGGVLFPGSGLRVAPVRVMNADGFSGTLDPFLERIFPTPQADLHPYRLFEANFTSGTFSAASPTGFSDPANPTGHSVLAMGASATSTFRLRMPPAGTQVRFGQDLLFVVSASWGQGAGSPAERQTPVYRLPEFNQKAAVKAGATLRDNTLAGSNPASQATLDLSVTDWQWPAAIAGNWPDTTSRGTIRAASSPDQIVVEIPGLLPLPLTLDPGAFVGAGVTRTLSATITNAALAPQGTYLGMVQVIDSLGDAQGIAQDDPVPTGLGQLRTAQLFAVTVGPPTGGGAFGPAIAISDRVLEEPTGFLNMNMPELVTDGTDLYLGYQGPVDEAVVARSTNGGASWTNIEVYQASPGAFLDPSIGCVTSSDDLQVLLAAPDETGMYASRSTNNGTAWSALLEVHDDEVLPDDSQAITSGPGLPFAVYGTLDEEGGNIRFVLDTATFTGTSWSERASISALKPGTIGGLLRIDESPMIYRLASNTLVCVFISNERAIASISDDTISEPVAVRSLDGGVTWQDWSYIRPLDSAHTIEGIVTAQQGDALFLLEVDDVGTARLHRSLDEGRTWTARPLPAGINIANFDVVALAAGPGQLQALIWLADDGTAGELVCALSDDGGDTWDPPLPCGDDPTKLYAVQSVSAAYTQDARLHVAFTADRGPAGRIGWFAVSQTP